MASFRWLLILLLEVECFYVTMTIKFDFGAGFDGVKLSIIDSFSETVPLPSDFTFFGSTYSSILVSDNGAISFDEAGADILNNMNFIPGNQWIAALGYDVYVGEAIWLNHYPAASTNVELATNIVRDFTGSKTYTSDYLAVVTWDRVNDDLLEYNTFQLALTQNSASESYIIFMYDTIETTKTTVKVGLSVNNDIITMAWDGNPLAACDASVTSSVREFPSRSQTECGTRAGVVVFRTSSNTSQDNVCFRRPNSNCPRPPGGRCIQRKRRDANDL